MTLFSELRGLAVEKKDMSSIVERDGQDKGLLLVLEKIVELSLRESSKVVKYCPLTQKPCDYSEEAHRKIGGKCICSNFGLHQYGLHYSQVLLGNVRRHYLDTVAIERRLPMVRIDSFVSRHYKHFFVDDLLDTTPSTELELQAYIENELDPDSLLHLLMHSKARIVRFSDRYSDVELVYGIALDDVDKTVVTNIRGTVNLGNWIQNLKSDLEYTPNPIVEDYPGKEDTIEMHGGYYEYLLRRRRDTGLRKYDEIADAISDLLRGKRANYRCVFLFQIA